MHSACSGCKLFGLRFGTDRTDQTFCHGVQLRSRKAACDQRSAQQTWRRHRRKEPAVLARCCLGNRPKTSAAAKQKIAKTCLNAFQYDIFQPPESSPKPLTIFKYWLYSRVPILRNEELVSRTAWTLMVIATARFGQQLRLPYVDASVQSGTSYTIEAMMGGSTQNPYNIFLLGIGPMINASLFVAVFAGLAKKNAWGTECQAMVQSWQNSGVEGHARMLSTTNLVALACAFCQAAFKSSALVPSASLAAGVPFVTVSTLMLTAGAAILRWLAESIEARGLGDGTSLLITLSIVTNYASVVRRVRMATALGAVSVGTTVRIGVGYIVLVALAVVTNSLTLRLPLIYYKQRRSKVRILNQFFRKVKKAEHKLGMMQAPGTVVKKRQAVTAALGSKGGIPDSAYLPLRLNPNGMAAVLYAGFIYSVPDLIGAFSVRGRIWATDFLMRGGWGVVMYGFIIFGCGLIQFGDSSPKSMGSYLNAVEAGIQGQSPGPSTEKFLKRKMKAVRFWGALSVALLSMAAQFYDQYCIAQIGTSISSLSLLLVVGLITSCVRQVQSLLQLPRLERALERERSVLQQMKPEAVQTPPV